MTEDEIVSRLAKLTEQTGRLPNYKQMQASDNKLRVAIMKDGRGLAHFAKMIGHNSRERWSPEKVELSLRDVVARIGHFPTQPELESLGLDHLCQATYKYGGGLLSYKEIICPNENIDHKYEVPYVHKECLSAVNQDDLDTLIVGSLLGDGSLTPLKGDRSNSAFVMTQAERRLEYIEFVARILGGGVRRGAKRAPIRLPNDCIVNKNELLENQPLLVYYVAYTGRHKDYTRLRKKWYPHGKKIVPSDVVLNPLSLAHWFVQDGHNHQTRTSITLHTNAFTVPDVEFLIGRLDSDLGITDANVQFRKGKPVIFIGKKSYFKFIETVRPYVIWKCFEYKVDTSKVKRARKNYGRYKLTMDDARAIRKLYFSDNHTQSQLAQMFGVTQAMIGRIVNNKAHIDHAVGFGGECEVKVNYNV